MKVLRDVLSRGYKCCSPVMYTCICAALFSSQVVTMSGPFRPVTSSTPVVSRGAVIAESYPPVRKILDAEGTRTVFI